MRRISFLFVLTGFNAAFAPTMAAAQELETPRIDGVITLDGVPDEPAWSEARVLPMEMFEPTFGAPITRTSTVRIAHDGEFLYAAGMFVDDGPVSANSLIRDHAGEDDFFNLVIDSFNDDETALWFLVTPAGTRVDGAITDNAEGASWNHPEFDNVWDAAAQITQDGWSAEMRIPLSSLRYEASSGTVRMGLIAGRVIVRLRERYTYPAIRPGPAVAHYKPSLAGTVVLHGVESKRPFEVRPYALGGWSQELRAGEEKGAVHEVGADVKVPVGHHSTLDLTINTDFAQTESDDERLNLNRFDLFYPEKRQFFLERSGIFDVGDDEDHRLFYSRRIGLSAAVRSVAQASYRNGCSQATYTWCGATSMTSSRLRLGALGLKPDGAVAARERPRFVRVMRMSWRHLPWVRLSCLQGPTPLWKRSSPSVCRTVGPAARRLPSLGESILMALASRWR